MDKKSTWRDLYLMSVAGGMKINAQKQTPGKVNGRGLKKGLGMGETDDFHFLLVMV